MNYKMVLNTLGKVMLIGVIILILPLLVSIIYSENLELSFIVPIIILLVLSIPCLLVKPKNKMIYAKEGFVIVALCWILLSVIGAIPYVISGAIPNYVDALFECASGFTTTGASVLSAETIDKIYQAQKSIMFWRLFTHFIGGMGVLVFLLALFPSESQGFIHIYRAESTGPEASKLVSKMKHTARILYAIYMSLTLLLTILLTFSGMGIYDSLLNAFSVAGTGGFSPHGSGMAYYNSAYAEIVMAVFMVLFGINFNVYYLIIIGCLGKALKSEELRVYLLIVISSTIIIAINVMSTCTSFANALRNSFFQTASIISTTGLATVDFGNWPSLSKGILLFLTMIGACGGSTGGGLKISRLMILFKSGANDFRKVIRSREVLVTKIEGEPVSKEVERKVRSFFLIWVLLLIVSTILISIDGFSNGDIFTDFSASLACISNVGPGLNLVGPMFNYGGYSIFSKLVLFVVMIAGRLEIFPILILLSPRTWRKNR